MISRVVGWTARVAGLAIVLASAILVVIRSSAAWDHSETFPDLSAPAGLLVAGILVVAVGEILFVLDRIAAK